MAGAYVSLVMQAKFGVDPSAKLVMVAIADCANVKHNGVAFPSVAVLMDRTGLGERSVQGHLRELTAGGWLEVIGASNGGRGMATRYKLNLPKMRASVNAKGAAHRTLSGDGKGAADCGDKAAVNGAAGCGDTGELKGAAQCQKPRSGLRETPQPAAPDQEVNRNIKGETHPSMLLRDVLNRKVLKEALEPEKTVGLRNVSAKAPGRSQAEQVRWIEDQLAKGKA